MSEISNKSYPESEKIHILISMLDEIEKINQKNNYINKSTSKPENMISFQSLSYEAIQNIADNENISSHQTERTLNDIIIDGDMRYNIVNFGYKVAQWLVTSDKTTLKEILLKNASSENYADDLQSIEKWFKKIQ